jgi:heavy metal sensor kinase
LKRFSIRTRLAGWYTLSLLGILTVFTVGAHIAMTMGPTRALDHDLTIQATGIGDFLAGEAPQLTPTGVMIELKEMTQDGTSLLIRDEHLKVMYQIGEWPAAYLKQSTFTPGQLQRRTVRSGPRVDRLVGKTVSSGGHLYQLLLGHSLREYEDALSQFQLGILVVAPFTLALAAWGGYWLSSRAFAPISGIINETRKIGVNRLSERLTLPPVRDELYDLTETINSMLDRLENSVNQIQQFTGDASHELRAPLTLIRTVADFSVRRPRSVEELSECLQKILDESERMSRLVDHLLLLSRTDSGTYSLDLGATNLESLLEQAIELVRAVSTERSVTIELQAESSLLSVRADDDALRRVAYILLDNAVKYGSEGGHVTVTTGAGDGFVWFSVADDGIGIGPLDLPKVFDRFWRADQVRSRGKGGLGLGLSIAKKIVEQHGGKIAVSSVPGEGSTFTVTLPAA